MYTVYNKVRRLRTVSIIGLVLGILLILHDFFVRDGLSEHHYVSIGYLLALPLNIYMAKCLNNYFNKKLVNNLILINRASLIKELIYVASFMVALFLLSLAVCYYWLNDLSYSANLLLGITDELIIFYFIYQFIWAVRWENQNNDILYIKYDLRN